MVYNASFIHCLAWSLASCCPYYIPHLRWRMKQRSTISKCSEGAPACKERAYWGIYTLPDLVVSEEKTRTKRETFDFLSAILLCLPSSWSRASSRGVVDTLLASHSQKKRKDGDPWLFCNSIKEKQAQHHQLRLSTIDLPNKMVNWNLPCWAPFHPDPSLIIITYCLTVIQICSRMGGPFYRGFTFFRLYLIAQSLGLFHRKPPEFWILT